LPIISDPYNWQCSQLSQRTLSIFYNVCNFVHVRNNVVIFIRMFFRIIRILSSVQHLDPQI